MKSNEFFNILDDMDERLVAEIYEDVQRPQKLVAVPRSSKRFPKILLGSAACLAVIAAAGLAVQFALPGKAPVLSGTSDTSEAPKSLPSESGTDPIDSETLENIAPWFTESHLNVCRRTDINNAEAETSKFHFNDEYYAIDFDHPSKDYELIASDNGEVVFAGLITEKYGSGVIIKYDERAYFAYGGLDPESVTVSAGDTVKEGEAFAKPYLSGCLGDIVARIRISHQPIGEEYFKTDCDKHCGISEDWFERRHINPYKRIGSSETGIGTSFYPGSSFYTSLGEDWSPEEIEFVAVDDGVVTFAGKISDAYGSAIVIKHAENVYVAYGGADPDTVTVSVGDTVTEGQALANPKAFKCFGVFEIGYFTASDKPITEEYFRAKNDSHYKYLKDVKSRIDLEENDKPDANGIHHITAKTGEEVKAVSDCMIVYADNGTVVALDLRSTNAFVVYKGLGAALPDYKVQDGCKLAAAGDTIGYVSSNSDASWFVLDPVEFERFAEENGIDIYPIHQFSKSMIIDKP